MSSTASAASRPSHGRMPVAKSAELEPPPTIAVNRLMADTYAIGYPGNRRASACARCTAGRLESVERCTYASTSAGTTAAAPVAGGTSPDPLSSSATATAISIASNPPTSATRRRRTRRLRPGPRRLRGPLGRGTVLRSRRSGTVGTGLRGRVTIDIGTFNEALPLALCATWQPLAQPSGPDTLPGAESSQTRRIAGARQAAARRPRPRRSLRSTKSMITGTPSSR